MAISIPRPDLPSTSAIPGPARAASGPLRARIVAFGSLGAFILAVVLIVATTGGAPARPVPRLAPVAAHPRFWIVRPGQTLSTIAAREGLSLDALLRTNPQLVPSSLRPWQRVRLPG